MKVTVTATQDEKLEVVSNCLANTYLFNGILRLKLSQKLYKKHSDALGDDSCHEDVLIAIIKAGETIKVFDTEGDEDVGELSLNKIEENWDKIRSEDILEVINENDDSDTADNILQCLTLGSIIYGYCYRLYQHGLGCHTTHHNAFSNALGYTFPLAITHHLKL
jgi:hypothetical protein